MPDPEPTPIRSARRLPIQCLSLAIPGLGLAAWVGGEVAAWVFAVLSVVIWTALAFLGLQRGDRPISLGLKAGLLLVALWLIGCFTVLLGLRGPDPWLPWAGRWLGMPLAMAIQVGGIFLVPLPVLAWLYARSFEVEILCDQDLAALSELSRKAEDA